MLSPLSDQLRCTWVHIICLLASHQPGQSVLLSKDPTICVPDFISFIYSWTSPLSPWHAPFSLLRWIILFRIRHTASSPALRTLTLSPLPLQLLLHLHLPLFIVKLFQKCCLYTLSPIPQFSFLLGPLHSGFLSTTHRTWSDIGTHALRSVNPMLSPFSPFLPTSSI